ncbi:MAG: PepSY domain-containing protein [Planctomycetota bacterium]
MNKSLWHLTALAVLGVLSLAGCATQKSAVVINEQDAVDAAIAEVGGELVGVRFDEPDTQWDVFVASGDRAFEVEVDAVSGNIVAVEEESLDEIRAELSGDLSHEGVEGDVD